MADQRVPLGNSDLEVYPLNLGGNVFGWTADREQSFAVLDAYADAGGNFIDTADVYSAWAPGHSGGESESVIGEWVESRGNRSDLVIATKVAQHPEYPGLSADNIHKAVDASLARLRTDHIDLYYAHRDDPETPLEETADALSNLVKAGKIRHIGISNYSPERITEWLSIVDDKVLHPPVALQPHYNLVERDFEKGLLPVVEEAGLAVLPYWALASGFLTGKYRGDDVDSQRASSASQYLNDHGYRVLGELDKVAAARETSVTAVALAWLRVQPTVVAPIASARTVEQLKDLIASVSLDLTADEVDALTKASDPFPSSH